MDLDWRLAIGRIQIATATVGTGNSCDKSIRRVIGVLPHVDAPGMRRNSASGTLGAFGRPQTETGLRTTETVARGVWKESTAVVLVTGRHNS